MHMHRGMIYAGVFVAVVVGIVVSLLIGNHGNSVHQQEIARCVVASGETWSQCASQAP